MPIEVEASGYFDGSDGKWSSFWIRVGTKPQNVRVLTSTLTPETWVIDPSGCGENDPSNCTTYRGETFDHTSSSTWEDHGIWSFGLEENLGYSAKDDGEYGYDTVGFATEGGGSVVLDHQVVAALAVKDFPVGSLGLAARTSNFGNDDQQQESLLKSLKDKNTIPSLSYTYNAGAYYLNRTATLIFGGYDAAKVIPGGVTIPMQSVATRDLVVGLQSIKFSNSSVASQEVLANGILTLIDSTIPQLWLPNATCVALQAAFGLNYGELNQMFTIPEDSHVRNMKSNANITLSIGATQNGGDTASITLPYAAFALNWTSPDPSGGTFRYFPLRIASDDTQYTLGRTFLQEAFLTVDYGNTNFTVAQADWSGKPSNIITIASPDDDVTSSPSSVASAGPSTPTNTALTQVPQSPSSGLPTGAIAGIAVAIVLLAVIAIGIFFFVCRRRRTRRRHAAETTHEADPALPPELPGQTKHARELSEASVHYFPSDKYDMSRANATTSKAGASGLPGVLVSSSEIDGNEVPSPPQRVQSFNRGGPIELGAEEIQRAELHSPEPPEERSDSRAATLHDVPIGDPPSARSVSPASRLSSQPWGYNGTNLEPSSPMSPFSQVPPDLIRRVSSGTTSANGNQQFRNARHAPSASAVSAASAPGSSAFHFPSPASELGDPMAAPVARHAHSYGSGPEESVAELGSPSAFTSPQIGYTRYIDDVRTPPPLSPNGLESIGGRESEEARRVKGF